MRWKRVRLYVCFSIIWAVHRMDGKMTCDFTSFPTVFQSYQDDGRSIMNVCVQGTPFTVEKIPP